MLKENLQKSKLSKSNRKISDRQPLTEKLRNSSNENVIQQKFINS